MPSWLITTLLLPAGYLALKRWQAHVSYRAMLAFPTGPETFEVADDETVPTDTREILDERAAPLTALGFVPLTFVRVRGVLSGIARTERVFHHPTENAFALIGLGLLGHELAISVELVTLFEDGARVSTTNGTGFTRKAELSNTRYVEAAVGTFAEQWLAHQKAVAVVGVRVVPIVDSTLVTQYFNRVEDESIRLLVARGEAMPTDDPVRFRLTPRAAHQRLSHLTTGMQRSAAASNAGGEFGAPRIPCEEQERLYEEGALGRRLRREASRPRLAFVLSAGAFAASLLLLADYFWLAVLMSAILFHELGHWTVMRLFGHTDAAITFIPFFGAATTTSTPFAKRWQEILMLLAGPVPGIVVGLALGIASIFQPWPRLSETGLFIVGLNMLNLLPLTPLDGGRLLQVLATAGRPQFDLALKALGAGAFIAGGLAMRDPLLGLLGLAGAAMLRDGYKRAVWETKIRRSPGFAPGLAAPVKRTFIFSALSDPPLRRFMPWLETVAQLELQLGRPRTPLWKALGWTGAFGGAWAGLAFAVASVDPLRTGSRCPLPSQAVAVSCAEGAVFRDINWTSGLITGEDGNGLPAIAPDAAYRAGAFVWCDVTDQDRADDLADRLREAAAGSQFCAALPWERAEGDASGQSQREARATLATLNLIVDPLPLQSARMLERYDRFVERSKGRPGFDLETATLYRTTLQSEQRSAAEASDALGIRLGRSPTGSCKRIAIANVELLDPEEEPSSDDSRQELAVSSHRIRFATKLARTADLDELGAYLCEAGCRVQILALMPTDARLSFCF